LENGHRVILFDASLFALQQAERRLEKFFHTGQLKVLQVILGEDGLPLPDNSADIIYARFSLHFFNKQQTVDIFHDLFRVLKSGGYAYLSVKSPYDIQDSITEVEFLRTNSEEIESNVFVDTDGNIVSRFSEVQWAEILKEAGMLNFKINAYSEHVYGGNTGEDIDVLAYEIIVTK
jgi:ubiquinone/menaquinone biosynthesis C-methylase UbiE